MAFKWLSFGFPVEDFPFFCWTPNVEPLHTALLLCSNNLMPPGKILAVDYGSKNIGLACSDELGLTVQPLPSIPNSGRRDLIKRLQTTVQAMGIAELVLGMPVNMDGTRGEAFIRMEQLLESLKHSLGIPATGVDERLPQ